MYLISVSQDKAIWMKGEHGLKVVIQHEFEQISNDIPPD
jgi:hypothetical protein